VCPRRVGHVEQADADDQQCRRQPRSERPLEEQLGYAVLTAGRRRLVLLGVSSEVASQREREQKCQGREQRDGPRQGGHHDSHHRVVRRASLVDRQTRKEGWPPRNAPVGNDQRHGEPRATLIEFDPA
jgi:hypothetical protein